MRKRNKPGIEGERHGKDSRLKGKEDMKKRKDKRSEHRKFIELCIGILFKRCKHENDNEMDGRQERDFYRLNPQ